MKVCLTLFDNYNKKSVKNINYANQMIELVRVINISLKIKLLTLNWLKFMRKRKDERERIRKGKKEETAPLKRYHSVLGQFLF